ncbi:MAG: WG repeat-containing protein [Oscillospiraceae bacterium]|nr:WG repeat-containing protein [Oscillospiraceae bacterium]
MKKAMSVIMILALFLSACASDEGTASDLPEEIFSEEIIVEEAEAEPAEEVIDEYEVPMPPYEEIALPPHLEDLNWLVKPGFTYFDWFGNCGDMHDAFSNGDYYLDERTGLPTVYGHFAHGGGGGSGGWIYDIELDLIGKSGSDYNGVPFFLKPRSEFAKHFPDDTESVKFIYSVDSTMEFEERVSNELPVSAYTGVAVSVDNEFITDFIPASVWLSIEENKFWIRSTKRAADRIGFIDESGKYGVIDRNGDVVLPFEFETVLVIDAWTAFVEFDGRWGIVAFGDYAPDFRPSGADYNYIDSDYLNESWQVVQNSDGLLEITDIDGNIFGGLDFEKIENTWGKQINGYRNGGDDVYHMIIREDDVIINYVQFAREWAGLINIDGDCLAGDISEAVYSFEQLSEVSVEYIKSLGYGIHHEIQRFPSIYINSDWGHYTADDSFSVFLTASNQSYIFEATEENGEWTVRDITSEVWSHY